MSYFDLNNIDIVILVILFFSGLTAFFRGFSKEVFSILGWVLAAFVTSYGLIWVQPIFRDLIKTEMFADLAASAGLFLGTSIIWAIITGIMARKVKKSSLGGIDKVLGLFFGLIRAVLLITLAYIFINFLLPKEDMPKIITDARSFSYVEKMADVITKFAPDQIASVKNSIIPDDVDIEPLEDIDNTKNDIYEKLIQPKINSNKGNFKGYDKQEREDLNQLFKEEIEDDEALPPPEAI
ncbi:MAG: CvpA family protein [Alphaproteobacteria bacterium]